MSIKFNCKKCNNWKCTKIFCSNSIYNTIHICKSDCDRYGKAISCQNEELEAIANENSIDNYCRNYKPKTKVP